MLVSKCLCLPVFAKCNAQDSYTHKHTNKILFYCAAFMFYAFAIFLFHFYRFFIILLCVVLTIFQFLHSEFCWSACVLFCMFFCINCPMSCVYELSDFLGGFPSNLTLKWILLQDWDSVVVFTTDTVVVLVVVVAVAAADYWYCCVLMWSLCCACCFRQIEFRI